MPELKEEKKAAAKTERPVMLFNRGPRTFDIGFDEGPNGKLAPRLHKPGTTHAYSLEEAKRFGNYKEIVDLSKLPGQLDAKALKDENNKLHDENKRLKAQLDALHADGDDAKKDKKEKKAA